MATANPLAGAVGNLQPRRPLQGGSRLRPAPLQGAVGFCQDQPARERRPPATKPQGQPPEGGRLQRDARKGRQPPTTMPQGLLPTVYRRPPAASLQGATDCRLSACRKAAYGQRHRPQGLPPARATASNGSACRGDARGGAGRRGCCPLAEWLPAGKGNRRLRRGNIGCGVVRVKEG
ncbi:hypothetical protein GW17_00052626 [Ensete ventricosum]|nr:hypothetical protein GW17_00052626 [Ensete ventricosum]